MLAFHDTAPLDRKEKTAVRAIKAVDPETPVIVALLTTTQYTIGQVSVEGRKIPCVQVFRAFTYHFKPFIHLPDRNCTGLLVIARRLWAGLDGRRRAKRVG